MAGNQPMEKHQRKKNYSFSIKKLVSWVFIGLGVSLLAWLIFINISGDKNFNSVSIEIEELPNKINFLTETKIMKMMDSSIHTKPFKKAQTEYLLEQNPYIKNAEVYIDLSKTLHCKIEQREPIVRIINQNQQQYYLDQEGNKFSCLMGTSARVVVANGFISEKLTPTDSIKTQTLQDIYKVARMVNEDVFWKQFTEQIYVDKYNELTLIPKVGIFTIVLGNSDGLEIKLKNLRTFIQEALPSVGWDKYKIISAKYKGQIITEIK